MPTNAGVLVAVLGVLAVLASAAFFVVGRRLGASGEITRQKLSKATAEETASLHKHFEHGVKTLAQLEVAEGGVYAVALSPTGDRVAAAGGDGTVRLYDVKKSLLASSFVPVEINKLVFNYDEVNGVNVVNRIATVPAPTEATSAHPGQPIDPIYP